MLVVMWLAACADREPVEGAADAALTGEDARFECVPAAPVIAGPTCLALGGADLTGTTPFGPLAVNLDYFGAGDCITISRATIHLRGACGEAVSLQFSYPVTSGSDARRRVETSFNATARFTLQPLEHAAREIVTMIHVEVAEWQEGDGTHDIDIVVTVTDPMFSLEPLHVKGTFCDWPYQLC